MPKFNDYDIMAKLGMIYEYMIEYLNILFSSKRDRLLVPNPIKNSRIMAE